MVDALNYFKELNTALDIADGKRVTTIVKINMDQVQADLAEKQRRSLMGQTTETIGV